MTRYFTTRKADDDLKEIYRYTLRSWGIKQARSYNKTLEAMFDMLSQNPSMGKTRSDIREGYRSFVKGQHVIFYRMRDDNILILRVLHSARDIKLLMRQESDDHPL